MSMPDVQSLKFSPSRCKMLPMSNNHYSRAHRAPQIKASSHRQLHLSFLSASSHRQPCKVIARKLKGVDVARAETNSSGCCPFKETPKNQPPSKMAQVSIHGGQKGWSASDIEGYRRQVSRFQAIWLQNVITPGSTAHMSATARSCRWTLYEVPDLIFPLCN